MAMPLISDEGLCLTLDKKEDNLAEIKYIDTLTACFDTETYKLKSHISDRSINLF